MKLDVLTMPDVEEVRKWRNLDMSGLRTPYGLTGVMQQRFYENVICNRDSNHRYWGIFNDNNCIVAMTGLTDIQWENGIAEISLVVAPTQRSNGLGKDIVTMVLKKAFGQLRLNTIFGECYECNPAVGFWKQVLKKYAAYTTMLPNRKFWDGQYYNSFYFSIDADEFNNTTYSTV